MLIGFVLICVSQWLHAIGSNIGEWMPGEDQMQQRMKGRFMFTILAGAFLCGGVFIVAVEVSKLK